MPHISLASSMGSSHTRCQQPPAPLLMAPPQQGGGRSGGCSGGDAGGHLLLPVSLLGDSSPLLPREGPHQHSPPKPLSWDSLKFSPPRAPQFTLPYLPRGWKYQTETLQLAQAAEPGGEGQVRCQRGWGASPVAFWGVLSSGAPLCSVLVALAPTQWVSGLRSSSPAAPPLLWLHYPHPVL